MPVPLFRNKPEQCPYGHSLALGVPKTSADALAALVDDVHFATRLPEHLITGAAVNVLQRYQAEIEAETRSAAGNG